MSRINLDDLPLTSDQARAVRNYFGLSQTQAAEESGLPLHKWKRFEAGNYIPDVEFVQALRDFFENRGYKFDDTPEPGAKAKKTGAVFPAGVVGETEENRGSSKGNRPEKASFHHMRIAITDDAEMGRVLDLIEENEDKVAELLRQPVETAFLGGLSNKSEAIHNEAIKRLAENGTLFSKLFGRDVGGAPAPDFASDEKKPGTHAEYLHHTQADALLAASGDAGAKERLKARKPVVTSLLS